MKATKQLVVALLLATGAQGIKLTEEPKDN
jgi:hypothetical protein